MIQIAAPLWLSLIGVGFAAATVWILRRRSSRSTGGPKAQYLHSAGSPPPIEWKRNPVCVPLC